LLREKTVLQTPMDLYPSLRKTVRAIIVRATLSNIPKQASCRLYKKVRVGSDEIDGVIMIRYNQEW